MKGAPKPPEAADRVIACQSDQGFMDWLSACGGSLAISTYQAGKLLLLGWTGSQPLLLPRDFDKPMGLDVRGTRLVLATRNAVTLFQNDTRLASSYTPHPKANYDALYLQRASYFTGDLDIHDVAIDSKNELWMVNTRFNCLATLSDEYSFLPQWRPAFISDFAPEDRCHLNGLALKGDRPAWVTALSTSDRSDGWRSNKLTAGVVIDVADNEVIVRGLAMPHSPRWYRNRLWVLNSGAGELLRIDPRTGDSEIVCTLPAYLRGLCFHGDHALIGLCKTRESNVFGGMPVQARYPFLKCGVAAVDLRTGGWLGTLEFTSGCTEIYDLRMLEGVYRPNILNLERNNAQYAVSTPPLSCWLRSEGSGTGEN